MPATDPDLLSIERGSVVAPAGCGKTELVAQALRRHTASKPILVLTHTNAGVAALRARLDRAGVPAKAYKLATIDGWAMRLISNFPGRSKHHPSLLRLAAPTKDYPAIRVAAAKLLQAGHVGDVIEASYARLIVDEYQDCSVRQHAVVKGLAQTLPTCVLGDPMQAIFGFGNDQLADWDSEVCASFPPAGALSTPWRWINANAEDLGHWLLGVRDSLSKGEAIDLRTAPQEVVWVALNGSDSHAQRLEACRFPVSTGGSVLIIGDSMSPTSQQHFAGATPGAVTIEAVDLRDLVRFATTFEPTAADALTQLAQFAENVMTNTGAMLVLQRVAGFQDGERENATDVERAALGFGEAPSFERAIDFLVEVGRQGGVATHRPAVLRACIRAMSGCQTGDGTAFQEAVIRMREELRLVGRPLPERAVGSTLLLKGLEADVVVILDAEALDSKNLYVALTRGAKHVVVCSATPILAPDS